MLRLLKNRIRIKYYGSVKFISSVSLSGASGVQGFSLVVVGISMNEKGWPGCILQLITYVCKGGSQEFQWV